jgi:flagellar basal-body rod protein FlgB
MPMTMLPDTTLDVLGRALDGLAKRESALATNVANIDTPGYAPTSVDFESALQAEVARGSTGGSTWVSEPGDYPSADVEMLRTDPRHFELTSSSADAGGATTKTGAESLRNDGNSVDLEAEMAALVDTQVRYGAVSRLVTGKLGMIRTAIGGQGS